MMAGAVVTASLGRLAEELNSLQNDFFAALAGEGCLEVQSQRWESLERTLQSQRQAGTLSPSIIELAARISSNVLELGSRFQSLEAESEGEIKDFTANLSQICGPYSGSTITQRKPSSETDKRASKRSRRQLYDPSQLSSDSLPSDSDSDYSPTTHYHFEPHHPTHAISPTPSSSHKPTPLPNDHLRVWFLQNLAYPYPTPAQKEALATTANVSRTKIDSDLTNWRRRSGWTDAKDRWAGGDKQKMRRLIEGCQRGKETREEVVEEVERMKGYLERREEEKVGDWVHELTSLAEKQAHPEPPHDHSLSTTSLHSSLSAVSAQVHFPTSSTRSFSTSSTSSSTSATSAYLWAPPPPPPPPSYSLKRSNVIPHEGPAGQRMKLEAFTPPEEEPLWLSRTVPHDHTSIYPTLPMSGIWSTDAPLPMLSHCTMAGPGFVGSGGVDGMGGGFEVPTQWEFQPVLDGWARS